MARDRWASLGLAATLALASGCANMEWQIPPPGPDEPPAIAAPQPVPQADPAQVAGEIMADVSDVKVLMDLAGVDPRVDEDVLLYQMGLLLLAPDRADSGGAKKVLTRLVKQFPNSPHRRAADTLLALLARLNALEADNASLHEDMRKILDIDLESERQRRATP